MFERARRSHAAPFAASEVDTLTLEMWNTAAAVGTFVVIAATAIAALVQLRHARGNNQIAALNELQETTNKPEFAGAQHYVLTELHKQLLDPRFRYELTHRAARSPQTQTIFTNVSKIGNFYENIGVLVKSGLVDRELTIDIWGGNATAAWEQLCPVAALMRRLNPTIWENFEYLVIACEDWLAAHPTGSYPRGMRRADVADRWRDEDARYAAEHET